jgi:hypothetical protein
MVRKREGILTGIMALAMYFVMVGVNALANILPINGITTGEVSDSFPNLFAPAGVTFSIWGVIYVLLGIYSVYGLVYINRGHRDSMVLKRVNQFYIISSIANGAWIYNWHHGNLGLTLLLMIIILVSLAIIVLTLESIATSGDKMLWARVPFSVYFGWITIATIANVTAFLVQIGWDGFGISESLWTIIVLLVGLIIGGTTIWRLQNRAYGAVLVWAYLGILLKHISQDGFDGRYPGVIVAAGVSIGVFISIIFLTARRRTFMFNANSRF